MSDVKSFKFSREEINKIEHFKLYKYLEILDNLNKNKNIEILCVLYDVINNFLNSRNLKTFVEKMDTTSDGEGWKRPSVEEVTWECCYMPSVNFLVQSHQLDSSIYLYGTRDTNDYDDDWHFIPKDKCEYSEDLYFLIYVDEKDRICSKIKYNHFVHADQYVRLRGLSGNEVISACEARQNCHDKFDETFSLKILADIFESFLIIEKYALDEDNIYVSKIFKREEENR